jgi:1-acyl-sn-glycerol-3-phosphate acyltransferase
MKNIIIKAYQTLLGIITSLMLISNTILVFIPFLIIGLFKLIPYPPLRKLCNKGLNFFCSYWIEFNSYFVKFTRRVKWNVKGDITLKRHQWYLVISNHQSWLDIVVLQQILHKRIPELKFFVKDQLKWVPFLGFAWWILDCPFMKRFSKEYLRKHPEKKGLDLLTTKKACQKFKNMPVSIMNFIEGTRFTQVKHKLQNSPYQHLLKPKAGGVAYVLQSMGERIHSIVDVTITYPERSKTLWDYLCGRVNQVNVYVRQLPIPEPFLKMNYFEDPEIKQRFQNWLNEVWGEKDLICEQEVNLITEK